MIRSALFAVFVLTLVGCGPEPSTQGDAPAAHRPGRKCPDLDLRDPKDPCSPMYLHRQKSRFKRDTL